MSETQIYLCPLKLKIVTFDSSKNFCPYCNKKHKYPTAISRKKDYKWHKNNDMWIDTKFVKQ